MRVLKAVRGQSELVLLSHPLDINRPEFLAEILSVPSAQLNIHTLEHCYRDTVMGLESVGHFHCKDW